MDEDEQEIERFLEQSGLNENGITQMSLEEWQDQCGHCFGLWRSGGEYRKCQCLPIFVVILTNFFVAFLN